ncbi:hypothetical protein, partial [Anabaena sp. CCY 0017]|uniref:hypothetical protein n=1 Tax=Anabaena sp. CCY 0017 TaxID=3103866 RepID=UPI0039C62A62
SYEAYRVCLVADFVPPSDPISTLNLPMLGPLFQPDDVTHESMSDRTSRTVGGDRSGTAAFIITQ